MCCCTVSCCMCCLEICCRLVHIPMISPMICLQLFAIECHAGSQNLWSGMSWDVRNGSWISAESMHKKRWLKVAAWLWGASRFRASNCAWCSSVLSSVGFHRSDWADHFPKEWWLVPDWLTIKWPDHRNHPFEISPLFFIPDLVQFV